MRLSQHFGKTLRDAPSDAHLTSHQLVVRAGLARQLAAGVWTYLPLGWRVLRKLEAIIREEMDAAGAEEMHMPLMHPVELWQASGRIHSVDVLQRLTNQEGRAFVLGPTHEEVVVDLATREIESYKDLPRLVYQVQHKVRDEPRARGGLIRLREFLMKDAYSLDVDLAGLDAAYERMVRAYQNVFARVDLVALSVDADAGAMGGRASQEFVLPHAEGEDRYVRCETCDYRANVEAARFARREARFGDPLDLEKVATPQASTIADLCEFLSVPPEQTLKAVFYAVDREDRPALVVMAMLRGDLDVSETKLMGAVPAYVLRLATDEEIRRIGAMPGYASPLGLDLSRDDLIVIGDESLEQMSNFVTGANEEGYHVINANFPRDFQVDEVADIAEVYDGATCTECGGTVRINAAIELGHCFKLGTFYSEKVGATFADENGDEHYVVMGSYGIGLERLMAAIIERHHDDYGIVWPPVVAPYDLHLVALSRDAETGQIAESLYADLQAAGVEVLYDDRNLSPGVMFADADLIGIPLRVTVSSRSLENGGVEVKWRHEKDRSILPLEGVVCATKDLLMR